MNKTHIGLITLVVLISITTLSPTLLKQWKLYSAAGNLREGLHAAGENRLVVSVTRPRYKFSGLMVSGEVNDASDIDALKRLVLSHSDDINVQLILHYPGGVFQETYWSSQIKQRQRL